MATRGREGGSGSEREREGERPREGGRENMYSVCVCCMYECMYCMCIAKHILLPVQCYPQLSSSTVDSDLGCQNA